MYHRVRRKMRLVVCAILILVPNCSALPAIDSSAPETKLTTEPIDNYENNVIDFDEEFSVKFSHKYDVVPWKGNKYDKDLHRYTIVKDDGKSQKDDSNNKTENLPKTNLDIVNESTTEADYSVIPLELISTTENYLLSIVESTTDEDLSVIPLSSSVRSVPQIEINQTVTLPTSTQESDTTDSIETTTESLNVTTIVVQTTSKVAPSLNNTEDDSRTDKPINLEISTAAAETSSTKDPTNYTVEATTIETDTQTHAIALNNSTEITKTDKSVTIVNATIQTNISEQNVSIRSVQEYDEMNMQNVTVDKNAETLTIANKTTNSTEEVKINATTAKLNVTEGTKKADLNVTNSTKIKEILNTNSSKQIENVTSFDVDSIEVDEKDVPIFTELDAEEQDVPEDYYDSKDVVTTTTPKASALSVLVGLAGSVVESVVESVAERVVPKGIYDLFKRMQRQSEALEAERLRSREENGGLGQFGRGILKTISSGLSKPFSQLMAGAKDIGSLDSDRGFVGSLASGVTSVATVATSLADAFKDRVQAIYPGTVWCGDGHSATARSGELGLFFFTDTCCRQHDACKIYIRAGDTKYGLTNTGLFTRSHCSCDAKFRECLRRTNSLVSAQIGLTYFNVLGPQCFRRAHPIVKCLKRTRITGQKCEEYEFDYTKPKMWQWFDNETF